MFQSLFWWILLLNLTIGSGMNGKILFQSLFWWILLLNQHNTNPTKEQFEFQSLFWWILLLNLQYVFDLVFIAVFQSLFWWILLLNCCGRYCFLDFFVVSILVLVDFALKLKYLDFIRLTDLCFNPCFGGFCS